MNNIKRTTVLSLFEIYAKNVIPNNASETQKVETKQAFFAGVFSVMQAMLNLADLSEEEGAALLDKWNEECHDFILRSIADKHNKAVSAKHSIGVTKGTEH